MTPLTPVVLGIDGRRGRWHGALLHPDGWVGHLDLADAREVLAAADATGAVVVGVDIPMGLPEQDSRPCDVEARRALPGAASRVFPAPPQAVLDAPTHEAAVAVSRSSNGHGVSIQVWSLRKAIAYGSELARDRRVVEVHPELSFAAMTGRVLASKKTPAGRRERLDALRSAGIRVSGAPGHDDALDALACAWTAQRWAAGVARQLGGEPDRTGRPVRIVV